MLDRAVGLVARTREVSMDVRRKEIVVHFIDGRVVHIRMDSDCVRILEGVALDVKGCSEPESQRNSMEGSADNLPSTSGSSPIKSPKSGKHKRQRSLLFSLISYVRPFHELIPFNSRANRSLVPKSLSSSASASPPPSAPPPTPLPPLPTPGRVTPLISPQRTSIASAEPDPDLLRKRARATLANVWRSYVIPALSPQHLPAAGYAEWTLVAIAGKVHAEIASIKTEKLRSRGFRVSGKKTGGSGHRRIQSEGRNAIDFGDRSDDNVSERCRAPSPFPGMFDAEDIDRVVYPRRHQGNNLNLRISRMSTEPSIAADEWGVQYADHRRSLDEADVFGAEFNGHNDSLLGEHFAFGDDWDDNERLTFDLGRAGHHGTGIGIHSSSFGDGHLHPDFGLDWSDDDGSRLTDMTFDMSRTPLVPSDINDDEESDDGQVSLRTPEEGEELPLAAPAHILRESAHSPQPSSVSRVTSSRPRSRNAPAQSSCTFATLGQTSHPTPSVDDAISRDAQVDEVVYLRCDYLERIYAALEIVRSRAREEGWRLVRATMIGAQNGWMDPEAERSLEIKAKRRAWSAGIKIYAPYSSTSHSAPKMWDGSFSAYRSPMSPPGLPSSPRGIPQVPGPIVPTGLSLGIPVQSSPLAMCAWGVEGEQTPTSGRYGVLSSVRSMETIERKRSSRVTFADSVTKLFPVCEDDSEDSFESVQVNAVGFPQAVPSPVSADEPAIAEVPADNEDDPFCVCPSRPRTRTTSMYMIAPTPSSPSSTTLPMFRPSTPPPSYQATVGGNVSAVMKDDEGKLDASALLLQPLSSLSISPLPELLSPRSLHTPNSTFVQRPRAVSLPTTGPGPNPSSGTTKTRRTSLHHKDKEERYEDLSRAYASPPPDGPFMVSATPAPHEQYPRYAHVYSPVPVSKKSIKASLSGRTGKEVVFEQDGSEFTVGIEVALGRAEEGRVVW